MAQRRDPADLMEDLAADVHALAFEMREPRCSTIQSDQIIAEGERLAAAVRRLVRG